MTWKTDTLYEEGGASFDAGLGLFDRERENIEAGQTWAAAHSGEDDDAARLCSDYPNAAAYTIALRLSPREQIRWQEAALAAARRLGLREEEGSHLGSLGLAYHSMREHRRAIELLEQTLAISREIGDRPGEGVTLGNMASAYRRLGELQRAVELYEQDLAISREIGDRRGEGVTLGNMGIAYAALGEPQRAIDLYEQHRAIARESGDRWGEARASCNLSIRYEALGELHKAVEAMQLGVDIFRAIRHRDAEMYAQELERLRAKLEP